MLRESGDRLAIAAIAAIRARAGSVGEPIRISRGAADQSVAGLPTRQADRRCHRLPVRPQPRPDRRRARGFGVTSCYRGGDGATKQEPGDYGLVATRHEQEGGVFRVDYRNGGLSICYLYFQREKQGDHEAIADQYVVCTPEWK